MQAAQFRLKDLFIAVGLLAIGLSGFSMMLHPAEPSVWQAPVEILLCVSSPIWFCMALAAPFRRKRLGAIIGLALIWLAFHVLGP
jgi:hypothetical protein